MQLKSIKDITLCNFQMEKEKNIKSLHNYVFYIQMSNMKFLYRLLYFK